MKPNPVKNVMLNRTFDILDEMSKAYGTVGISELSESLGISKATIFRILQTLLERGVVMQDDQERYSLGYTLVQYASHVKLQQNISSLAEPHMKKLSKETGETINLGMLHDDVLLHILSVPGEENIWMKRLVPVSDLYCSSGGKLFLAEQNEDFLYDYFSKPRRKRTIHTITTLEEFLPQLEKIRLLGHAHDNEEYEYGLSCCAYPIRSASGKLQASLSMSGPQSRIAFKGEESLWQKLKETAEVIEKEYQKLESKI